MEKKSKGKVFEIHKKWVTFYFDLILNFILSSEFKINFVSIQFTKNLK